MYIFTVAKLFRGIMYILYTFIEKPARPFILNVVCGIILLA